LFGLKVAVQRATTAKGEQYGHAYYNNWRESVQDYALFFNRYLANIQTSDKYFEFLKQNYAEDPNYVNKLKTIVSK
jgi:flagellum-specific peptidoglycan hydrolase FlgJ